MSLAIIRASTDGGTVVKRLVQRIHHALPKGRPLPDDVWGRRHRGILALLWLHVLGIVCFGVAAGHGLTHSLAEAAIVASSALLAGLANLGRTFRAVIASFGLVTASAVLVHLSGGYIELHFHFFVMLIIIALYQEWLPFLLAIGYVAIHHGLIGTITPHDVYNHAAAWANPWLWAAIHALFVMAASIACIVNWRLIEAAHADAEGQKARATRLHTLARLNQLISASLTMSEVLREIATAAATLMKVPYVSFWIVDESAQSLELRACSDEAIGAAFPMKKRHFSQGPGGWVATHRQPLNVPDVFADHRFTAHDWLRTYGLSSYCGVPVLFEDSLLAVLVLHGRRPLQFKPDDQVLLDNLVAQAAIAIRNASLYEALRGSEERTRLIIENALDAVITMDQHGVIVDWNPQAEATFGWSRQEAVGQSLATTIIPPAYREAHRRGLQHFLTAGEGPALNKRIEVVALHRDGHEFPAELSILPMRVGQTFIFSAFIRDITKRKRAEADLQQAKDAAEAAARAKGEFLANMSHEIRTPMNGIIGMAELLFETPLTAEQHEYLGMVKTSADALLHVIDDILDFSKIEAGKLHLDSIAFNLRDCLGTALKALALHAHQKGLELAYQVHHTVPDVLIGDPGRLRQILVNLVGNAIKFTERGEVVVEIHQQEACANEPADEGAIALRFSVRDTGIGIPPDKQSMILEPFMQADGSTTRKYGGTGLGLAISKQLVELMRGRFWIDSEAGRGSTFQFTASFGVPHGSAATEVPEALVDVRDLPVLVIDDNATTRRILHEMLSHWQMKPTVVEGGQAALRVLAQARDAGAPFPLVLLDTQMPEMDGYTLAVQIKQDPTLAGVTILMLSAAELHDATARCWELGIAISLTKPIAQADLWDAIMTTLQRPIRALPPALPVSLRSKHDSRRRLRILLVEDNAINQSLVVHLLEKRRHQVTVVSTGKEALAALTEHAFDLILMDIQMPEMDGFEATAAIRRQEQSRGTHSPIIAITAHAMKGDCERCLRAGMDAYVTKPMRAADLDAAIDRLCRSEAAPDIPPGEPPIDVLAALHNVDGDKDLLADLGELFLQDSPGHVGELQEAISHGNAHQLERTAHRLKGAVGALGATTAYTLAYELEIMGQATNLERASSVLEKLEHELERIARFFAESDWKDCG